MKRQVTDIPARPEGLPASAGNPSPSPGLHAPNPSPFTHTPAPHAESRPHLNAPGPKYSCITLVSALSMEKSRVWLLCTLHTHQTAHTRPPSTRSLIHARTGVSRSFKCFTPEIHRSQFHAPRLKHTHTREMPWAPEPRLKHTRVGFTVFNASNHVLWRHKSTEAKHIRLWSPCDAKAGADPPHNAHRSTYG